MMSGDTIALNMINECMAVNVKTNRKDDVLFFSKHSNTHILAMAKSIDLEICVTAWRDMTHKFGLGYLLSNKSVGVYFNDNTKIILHPRGTYVRQHCIRILDFVNFRYYEYYVKTAEKIDILSRHNLNEPPPAELKKKVTILQRFRDAFKVSNELTATTTAENSSKKIHSGGLTNGTMELQIDSTTATDTRTEETSYLPFIKKFSNTKLAYLFRLNNKIVQVFFEDKTQIVMSSYHGKVIYHNKKGEKGIYDLNSAMENENKEMSRRLRYTKELVGVLLNQVNQANNTNANSKYTKTDTSTNPNQTQPVARPSRAMSSHQMRKPVENKTMA